MEIEIPFGAKDSELKGWEYTIPEDMEAVIKDGKVIVKKKDSEDEKIRKEILDFIQLCLSRTDFGSRSIALRKEDAKMFKKWIAYLEKQKDIKLLSWRAVDECKDIPDGHYVVVAYNSPGVFELDTVFNGKLSHPNRGNLKATGVFYIPNADENTMCFIEKQKPDYCHHEVDLSGCSEEYSKGYYDGWNNCNQQHSQLEAEQKPAEWSEEDDMLMDELESYILYDKEFNDEQKSWRIKRLKSLRPKPHWKPSEEQLKALKEAINLLGEHRCSDILDNLLCDLDSLKPSWRPNEKQMEALKYFVDQAKSKADAATTTWDKYENICALYNDLKKL